jgi:2-polyprenyl-6-methoxyphenol hydroxylase-like FAD-dependent oxidoreductase
VLEARLESLGVRVERPLELVGLRQEPAAVVAELQTPSGREEVRAAYLIGADGAHSVVRKLLGLSFAGDRYPQDFLLADVDLDGDLPHGGVHLFMARSGVLACLPMKGERAYRVLATRGKAFASDEEPTLDEVRAVAASMSKISLGIESPRWLARFKLHHRIVDRYRHGRVFVAGDAAHIHSPAGGQGMNTGMQDADNLAWKLALVVTRKAPPALLESYEQERRPVGVRLLGTTDRLFRFGSSSDWLPAQLRRFVVPRVAPRVLGHPKRRARALRFVSQLGIRYSKSALSQGRSTKESLATGDRAPDGKLDDGGWLLARLGGKRFHVVAFRDRVTAAELAELARSFASFADIVDVHAVAREREGDDERIGTDASGVLRERYGCALCLLRPDGYIATRVGGDDPRALVAWLETHVGAKGES